jgi:hypothetical protein
MVSIGSITTPSDRRGWLIASSSFLRAGSQFHQSAQRYHNSIFPSAWSTETSAIRAARLHDPAITTCAPVDEHRANMLKAR